MTDFFSLVHYGERVWQAWHEDFSAFTTHAVDLRYPGEFATAEDADNAVRICTQVRQAVRVQLKLPAPESI